MISEKLKSPISWLGADQEISGFLDRIQGNILKFHGRFHVVHLFCQFRDEMREPARSFLKRQISRVQTGKQQLQAAVKAKEGNKDPAPFVSVFLTKPGYDYLGVPVDLQPKGAKFQNGMAAAGIGDPDVSEWDSRLVAPHAMILVAHTTFDDAQVEAEQLLNEISEICTVAEAKSGPIIGTQYFNEEDRGIEHFGYVDGRSQPLVLAEDPIKDEMPKFPVDQFVVPDPAIEDELAYGSYYVFRQLEQNVAGFKGAEDIVEDTLAAQKGGTKGMDSSVVGRKENGTPFEVIDTADTDETNVTNDFRFETDPPRCPVFAHIRKVNPRRVETNGRLMIRRATTYGQRPHSLSASDPNKFVLPDEETEAQKEQRPTSGVGLLFQSYQADIEVQFEWAQLGGENRDLTDCVIGTSATAVEDFPIAIASPSSKRLDFFNIEGAAKGPFVTMRGGGYFFAPSIPFLQSL